MHQSITLFWRNVSWNDHKYLRSHYIIGSPAMIGKRRYSFSSSIHRNRLYLLTTSKSKDRSLIVPPNYLNVTNTPEWVSSRVLRQSFGQKLLSRSNFFLPDAVSICYRLIMTKQNSNQSFLSKTWNDGWPINIIRNWGGWFCLSTVLKLKLTEKKKSRNNSWSHLTKEHWIM